MYERRSDSLLPLRQFATRLLRHGAWAAIALLVWLAVGVAVYKHGAHLEWADAFLNASMILSGMGPVYQFATPPASDTTKVLVSLYALVSGVVFLAAAGAVVAPVLHRFLHWLHLSEKSGSDKNRDS